MERRRGACRFAHCRDQRRHRLRAFGNRLHGRPSRASVQTREWTNASGISCFIFEAFDEQWKDAGNPNGSENHFGLFKLNGEAKYALWKQVDLGVFKNLTRAGNPIVKTYSGDEKKLLEEVMAPPTK